MKKRERIKRQELETEPDWESIEQNLADYPDLAAYEDKIKRAAALQRMLRFASEKNWDAFANELGEHPELVEHEPSIRHEATLKRLQKAVSERDWDAAGAEFETLSAAEKKAFSEEVFKRFHWLAVQQAQRSTGQTESESFLRAAIHYDPLQATQPSRRHRVGTCASYCFIDRGNNGVLSQSCSG